MKFPKAPATPAEPEMPAGPSMHEHEFDNPETHEHLHTLIKAEGIKGDPTKMARVQALAGRHEGAIKAIKSVQDIKDVYDNKYGSGALKGGVKQPAIPQPKAGPDLMPKPPKTPKPKVKV